jgi:hypothetical protein
VRALARRRLVLVSVSAAALVGLSLLHRAEQLALRDAARRSGWLLLLAVVMLALYGVRRRLPYPPLLDASTWLQGHLWFGIAALVLYFLHAGFGLPNGPLETSLALSFAVATASGLVGIALSRSIPRRLTLRGHEVIAERIPALRRRLRDQARAAVQRVSSLQPGPLAEFYASRLDDFFEERRNLGAHLLQSQRPLHTIRHELSALDRYLGEAERGAASELRALVEAKDALDYHAAMQGLLKGWLLIHVPATAVLLILALLHGLLALGFPGAWP